MARFGIALGCIVALLFTGCATVRPWEREQLAKRCMQARFGQDALAAQYREKVVETTTGGGLPESAPGGGCGCSQ